MKIDDVPSMILYGSIQIYDSKAVVDLAAEMQAFIKSDATHVKVTEGGSGKYYLDFFSRLSKKQMNEIQIEKLQKEIERLKADI
jgi:hypothetical protein